MDKKKSRKGNVGRVLEYLKSHKKGITSMEAFEMFGATRLSAIIYVLRKEHNIESVPTVGKNRYGETTYYDRYVLHK